MRGHPVQIHLPVVKKYPFSHTSRCRECCTIGKVRWPEVNIYPRKWNCISRDGCAKWNQPVSIPFSLFPSMEYEKRFPPLVAEKGKGKPPPRTRRTKAVILRRNQRAP